MGTVRSWCARASSGAVALLALTCALGVGASAASGARMDSGAGPAALAATCGTDEFAGSALDDARWDVLRPAGGGPAVAGGKLGLPIRTGDFIANSATAENVVLQDAPPSGWTATTRLSTAAIDVNGEQAGLVLWKGEGPPNADNAFGKIVAIQTNAGVRRFEAIWTDGGGLAVPIPDSGADIATWPADVSLRLRYDGRAVTAEYSVDGTAWTRIGRPARYDGALRAGVLAIGGTTAGTGGTVEFERFELSCGPEVGVTASDQDGTAPLDVDFSSTVSEPDSELSWDFGDGGTADGGATQSHTFTQPGTYRVALTAEDADGNTTVGSARVVVRPSAPAHSLADEFTGNALDPKWEILRPRLTGLDLAGGALRLTSYGGDMHGTNASARNVVLQPLPAGAVTASTKIDVSGLTAPGDQVGMVVWRSESPNHFAKVVFNRRGADQYWFERSRTNNGDTSGSDGGNSGAVTGPVPGTVHLRITSSGGADPTFTPESSVDGTTWSPVRSAFSLAGSGPIKIGLTYFSGDALRVAAFDYFHAAAPTSPQTNLFDTIGITRSETRGNSGIFGEPTNYSLPSEEMPPSRTVGPGPDDEADDVPLRMPDTSGNVPNLAAFHGQTLTLRPEDQKPYSKIHLFGMTTDGGPAGGDFVLRYSDNSTQSIRVDFRDWCNQQDTPEHHVAIGPLTQRYRTVGEDGAPCSIYHVPKTAQAAKTLVSVTLPSTTTPGDPPIQGYLMALTLEEPSGLFEMPDLSGSVQFPDDDEAPVTTHTFNPAAPDGEQGWYAGPVRVTLAATDEAGGSGVEQMMYRVDGGPPKPYGGPFDYAVDGEHTLEYRSVDGAGNAEAYKPVTLKVDANAPTTTATARPGRPLGAAGWYDSAVELTLSADDGAGSGTAATEYRVDGGEWQPYDEPIAIEEAGVHDVEFHSSDVAGNDEAIRRTRLSIDETAPVTSARINGAAPQPEYTGAVRVALIRTDGDGSGVVRTDYRIGDGPWTEYTGAFDIDGDRGHRVDFRSLDLAGNVENFRTVTFVIRPGPAPSGGTPSLPGAAARARAEALALRGARGADARALDDRRAPRRPARGAGELPVRRSRDAEPDRVPGGGQAPRAEEPGARQGRGPLRGRRAGVGDARAGSQGEARARARPALGRGDARPADDRRGRRRRRQGAGGAA